jgi:uncharacterized protein (DUF58 family)
MHLSERAHFLIVATAVLAITGFWSDDRELALLWCWPAALLLTGLACEGFLMRRLVLRADVAGAARALLGRAQPAAFEFCNESGRRVTLEYAPVVPAGIEPLRRTRRLSVPGNGSARDPFTLSAVRLGRQAWPKMPVRCLGAAGLAWWTRELPVQRVISVAPDSVALMRARPRGHRMGLRSRRVRGAGSELHQLRAYAAGDPLARIDWKATARSGTLVTREFIEDQHLDILIAIDAGRSSRVRAGRLDRLGLYANIAARFAQIATRNDDRVGLVVYCDRPLSVCAPERGLRGVARLHQALATLDISASESDPVVAALRMRALLKHRTLIIMLTDLDDAAAAQPLLQALRLLAPPHLVMVAAVQGVEVQELTQRSASAWRDPWVALAAFDHEKRSTARRLELQQLGAPVVIAAQEKLQDAVFAEYERLRRRRRI